MCQQQSCPKVNPKVHIHSKLKHKIYDKNGHVLYGYGCCCSVFRFGSTTIMYANSASYALFRKKLPTLRNGLLWLAAPSVNWSMWGFVDKTPFMVVTTTRVPQNTHAAYQWVRSSGSTWWIQVNAAAQEGSEIDRCQPIDNKLSPLFFFHDVTNFCVRTNRALIRHPESRPTLQWHRLECSRGAYLLFSLPIRFDSIRQPKTNHRYYYRPKSAPTRFYCGMMGLVVSVWQTQIHLNSIFPEWMLVPVPGCRFQEAHHRRRFNRMPLTIRSSIVGILLTWIQCGVPRAIPGEHAVTGDSMRHDLKVTCHRKRF